jgi:hypothetical protein
MCTPPGDTTRRVTLLDDLGLETRTARAPRRGRFRWKDGSQHRGSELRAEGRCAHPGFRSARASAQRNGSRAHEGLVEQATGQGGGRDRPSRAATAASLRDGLVAANLVLLTGVRSPAVAIAMREGLKTWVELRAHLREHRKLQPVSAQAQFFELGA